MQDKDSDGWYRLISGRQVMLQQVLIRRSALGIYIGSADAVRARVLERLPEDVEAIFYTTGVFIKEPPPGSLPRYVFMADLHSLDPVHPGHDCSSLVVCWFNDHIGSDLNSIIEAEVLHVDWDAHAIDGDY